MQVLKKKKCFISNFVFVSFICMCPLTAKAVPLASTIQGYFKELESDIEALAARREMLMRKTGLANKPIAKLMKDRSEIISIIRTNSRGLVVNEKHTNRSPGKKYRNLSRQRWFREISRLDNYYGLLTTSTGRPQLFWCVPIKVKQRSGSFRPGGAIVTKIDLRDALRAAAKKAKQPFKVYESGRKIFTHDWKESAGEAEKQALTIYGMENLEIAGLKKQDTPAPAAKAGKDIAPGTSPAGATAGQPPQPKVIKKRGKIPVALIVLFVVVGLTLGIAAVLFQHINRKRHEKLVDNIDREVQPFEYSETVVMDRTKLLGTAPPEAAAGGQQALFPSRDPIKETRIMSLDQMRHEVEADVNQKVNAVLSERTKQIRKEVYAEVRFAFLKNMKAYSTAIGQQVQHLTQYAAVGGPRSPEEMAMLKDIINNLQRIQNSIEGR